MATVLPEVLLATWQASALTALVFAGVGNPFARFYLHLHIALIPIAAVLAAALCIFGQFPSYKSAAVRAPIVASAAKVQSVSPGLQEAILARELEIRRQSETLALAAFYEAGLEGDSGMLAVMCVILNRVEDPRFPSSIRNVVYQRAGTYHQFSFLNPVGLHAGARGRGATLPGRGKGLTLANRARRAARGLLQGDMRCPHALRGIVFYLNPEYVRPAVLKAWHRKRDPFVRIGSHVFWLESA